MPTDAGIEPRTVATSALAVRRLTIRLDLIRNNEKVHYVLFFDLEERGCRVEEEEGKREDVEPLGDANGQVEHQVACVGISVNIGWWLLEFMDRKSNIKIFVKAISYCSYLYSWLED